MMNIEFQTKVKSDKIAAIRKLIDPAQATIFTRDEYHRECIAIIPTNSRTEVLWYWVWLSSRENGAHGDGRKRSLTEIATTLISGEWIYQPNATMYVDSIKDMEYSETLKPMR